VKGNIREIEVKPGGEAEWYSFSVKAGTFDLQCTIACHAAAGMTGKLSAGTPRLGDAGLRGRASGARMLEKRVNRDAQS
jgi:hypothetical protein